MAARRGVFIDVAKEKASLIAQFKKNIVEPIARGTVGGSGKSFKPQGRGLGGFQGAKTLAVHAVKDSKNALKKVREDLQGGKGVGAKSRAASGIGADLKKKIDDYKVKIEKHVLGDIRGEAEKQLKKYTNEITGKVLKEADRWDFETGRKNRDNPLHTDKPWTTPTAGTVLNPQFMGGQRPHENREIMLERRRDEFIKKRISEYGTIFIRDYVKKEVAKMKEWAGLSEWHIIEKEWEYIRRKCIDVEKSDLVKVYYRAGRQSVRFGFADQNAAAYEQMITFLGLDSLAFDVKTTFSEKELADMGFGAERPMKLSGMSFSSSAAARSIQTEVAAGFPGGGRYAAHQQTNIIDVEHVAPVPIGYEDVLARHGGPRTADQFDPGGPVGTGVIFPNQPPSVERTRLEFRHRRRVMGAMRLGQFPDYSGGQPQPERVASSPPYGGGVLQARQQFTTQTGGGGALGTRGDFKEVFATPGQVKNMRMLMTNKLQPKFEQRIKYFFKVYPQYRTGLAPYFYKPEGKHFKGLAGGRARHWNEQFLKTIGKAWKRNIGAAIKHQKIESDLESPETGGGGERGPKNLGSMEDMGSFLEKLIKELNAGLQAGQKKVSDATKKALEEAAAKRKAKRRTDIEARRKIENADRDFTPFTPPMPVREETFAEFSVRFRLAWNRWGADYSGGLGVLALEERQIAEFFRANRLPDYTAEERMNRSGHSDLSSPFFQG